MPRDNFSKKTLDTLSRRVALRCSNPHCRKVTAGPRAEEHAAVNIGVGAHITAAATGGPRFDPNLSSNARSFIANGIWLCQNCAKLIDNDANHYTSDLLRAWKTQAEQATRSALAGSSTDVNDRAASLAESRRQRIAEWRHAVSVERYDFIDYRSRFLSSAAYASLRPHLRPEVIAKIEAPRTIYVGGARGDNVRQYTLLDEISRIERDWGLV